MKKRIKVAMIAPPWLPIPPVGYGGIENVLAFLVPELIKLGVNVELFTVGDSKVNASKTHSLYKHSQYAHIHRPMYESMPIAVAQLFFALNKISEDGKFDLIHDHSGFVGPLALYFSDNSLPPAIHTLHGPPFSNLADQLDLPDNQPMWREFKKNKKLKFVGISDALTKAAPKEMKPLILPTVYNAIDVSKFPFVDKKDDYFITLARFHPDKGQDIAVRACVELNKRLKMAGVVGDITTPNKMLIELANPLSPYRSLVDFRYYSDQIFPYLFDHKIEYVGQVKGRKKRDFISQAKALLFPIMWDEPFGMVAIEALACGTPVISMNRGAMPEIVEHGVTGFLARNEKEFKYYITRIDEIDPAKCREAAIDKFSAHTMAKNYLDRYTTVINGNLARL